MQEINKMEEYVNAEPEILIRDFIETYRNFLEKLEDPQVLLCLSDVEDNQARGGATLSASGGKETIQDTQRKVAWLLSQLKAAYDKRLNMIQLDFKVLFMLQYSFAVCLRNQYRL